MSKKPINLSRRQLVKAGSAGIAAGTLSAPLASAAKQQPDNTAPQWQQEVDVIVCGSGAAGSIAALFAAKAGSRVMLVEKSTAWGGTSAKSGFHIWVPNNPQLQAAGIEDEKLDCLRYMVQYSYPHLFNPESPTLGIQANTYQLLAAFYDNASPMIQQVMDWTGLNFNSAKLGYQQRMSPDYYEHSPWNKVPQGRGMEPVEDNGRYMPAMSVVGKIRDALIESGVDIRMQHSAEKLHVNRHGAVIGLQVKTRKGEALNIRSRKGIVFGTGCYTHNKQYMEQFQMMPVIGGCAVATNEGDFIGIAGEIGAQMGNLSGAWRAQVVLEETINYKAVQSAVFWPHGDSMIVVNKYGQRFGNEKRNYNDRAKVLYHYDANRCEYPNLINFMIYDQRTADLKAGHHPIPPTNEGMDYVIKGNTLQELVSNIAKRLDRYKAHTGNTELDIQFAENLEASIKRFNAMAMKGKDEDFGRGSYLYDQAWYDMFPTREDPRWPQPPYSDNTTLFPLQDNGPYYAIILGPGSLGTNGGPVTNNNGQVLNYANQPIEGLYAAGNCMAHPAANGYWAAGATIGTAMTFGKIAGESASHSAVKEVI